jgi:hypothetical protein
MTTSDAERAYLAACAARGAPMGELEIRFRRVFVGARLDDSRLERAPIPHYVHHAPPTDVPAGARWVSATAENLDGGPNLRDRVAVLDLPHPHLVEDVAALETCWDVFRRAPLIIAELHARAAAWGLTSPRVVTWTSPRLAVSMIGRIDRDDLGELAAAVREVAYEALPVADVNVTASVALWRVLAERRVRWPRHTDDTYYPGISIPDAWVGRSCDELPNPFEPLDELAPVHVIALGGDHAVLEMP